MRKTILSAALMVLAVCPDGFAQSSTVPKNSPQPAAQAPVGHRQVRPSDVPNDKNPNDPNDVLARENAVLDKKIKSICRGC
jgi:hypothetical protein